MSLGSNISNKRKSLKLSQEYVAEHIGVSRQAVSKWETNQSEPSTDNLIKLADLFEIDIKELVSPKQYVEQQKDVETRIDGSQKDIKMQMSAWFGRILMLVSFLGYMGASSNQSDMGSMPLWYSQMWYGVLFLIGVVLTFIGARDYFNRKSGSKKIIWLDLLFVFSYFLYGMLPFERSINAFAAGLFGTVIIIVKNIKFFIPIWRKPRSSDK